MNFKDSMAADAIVFFNIDETAETVEYNDVEIAANVDIGASNQKGNILTSEGMSDRALFEVQVTDVPNPKSGDEILHNGKTWTVNNIISSDDMSHVLECLGNQSSFGR